MADKDDIAICSLGLVGVITGQREVTYPDGNKAQAYVGYHLSEPVGNPWSSRNPKVIGHAPGLADFIAVTIKPS